MISLGFANKITLCRILLVPFFSLTILYFTPEKEYLRYVALGLFLFAVASDVVDGYIARVSQQKTKAGSLLDPLADKMLLISAFLCLYKMDGLLGAVSFPLWLVLAVISRDIILLLGSTIVYLLHIDWKIEPTIWGKATAFFQILCILGVLLQFPFSYILWWVTVALTIISGVGYIFSGIKVLNGN